MSRIGKKPIVLPKGVKLQVVDWGGSEPPMILLTGMGGTAHLFDSFARTVQPALAPDLPPDIAQGLNRIDNRVGGEEYDRGWPARAAGRIPIRPHSAAQPAIPCRPNTPRTRRHRTPASTAWSVTLAGV